MSQVAEGTVPIFPTFVGFRSKVTDEVDGAGKEGGSVFGKAFAGAVAGIATLQLGTKIKDYFVNGVKGASNLEQSVGAVGAIFKDSADQINQWSASAATDVGLTKNEFNELGTLIGAQLKNGGTAMDQLAPKTNDLIGLGADLSSMFGGDTKTAVEALSSALKGERDPIERYGVSLNQAKIDAEAAALGFEKVGGTLSSEANQAATLSLIMKQTADAHGNFASEADTVAGKQQRLNAIWENGKTSLSNAFLPALGAVQGFLLDKLPGAITTAEGFVTTFTTRFGEFWAGFTAPESVTTSSASLTSFGATAKGVVDRVVEAVAPLKEALGQAFATGDFSSLSSFFSGFLAVAQPAGPIIGAVGTALGSMSGKIGGLIVAGLPLLVPLLDGAAGAMQFLSEHTGILTALIVAIAGAMVIYRTAQVAANVASVGAVPAALAQAAANVSLASAIRANTAAGGAQLVVERQSLASRTAGAMATVRQTVATVASRVAMAAGAVATGVATAAQWAWNAALSANPIGIIIIAVAALVAALVYFFTQTDLGREVWANFMSFLVDAWNNIVAVAQVVWQTLVAVITAVWDVIVLVVTTYINTVVTVITTVVTFIVTVWNTFWTGLSLIVSTVWAFIVLAVTTYINLVVAVITSVVSFIVGVWNAFWAGISLVVSAVWAGIVAFVTAYINIVMGIISTVVNRISSVWTSVWSGISAFFGTIWRTIAAVVTSVTSSIVSGITGFVTSVQSGITSALDFITGLPGKAVEALGDLGSKLLGSGKALIQGFIDGITAMVGKVGDAVGGVLDFAKGFFPNSPADRGPFSGSGWTRIKKSGTAILDAAFGDLEKREVDLNASLGVAASAGRTVPLRSSGDAAAETRTDQPSRAATVNVYPQPGMSEETIGGVAADRLNYELRRG
jgi:phage-related protein